MSKPQIYSDPIWIRISREHKALISLLSVQQLRTEASIIREAVKEYLEKRDIKV